MCPGEVRVALFQAELQNWKPTTSAPQRRPGRPCFTAVECFFSGFLVLFFLGGFTNLLLTQVFAALYRGNEWTVVMAMESAADTPTLGLQVK